MINTDLENTGAGVGTPPAVGMRSADRARLGAAVTVRPALRIPAPWGAVAGVPTKHTSNTPGDLPPEDPLSR